MARMPLTAERLRDALHYCPVTGHWSWKNPNTKGNAKKGARAGSNSRADGYRAIRVDCKNYLEHRLAFFYMTGAWPTEEIDHIDGNRANNAWSNLREVTRIQNIWNNRAKRHSETGLKGVERYGRQWLARVRIGNGQRLRIGIFATAEEASAAYLATVRSLHGAYAADRGAAPTVAPQKIGIARHGMRGSPEYSVWMGMRRRCLNPTNPAWKHYGGRGITICSRWQKDFAAFYADMGARPSRKHQLERVDNEKGYSPENCRWATSQEQALNRRRVQRITYRDETLSLSGWAKRVGMSPLTLSKRMANGMSFEAAIARDPGLTIDGQTQSRAQWARDYGLPENTLLARIRRGWTGREILSPDRTRNWNKRSLPSWGAPPDPALSR